MVRQENPFYEVRRSYESDEVVRYFQDAAGAGFVVEEMLLAEKYVSPGESLLLVGGGGGREALAWTLRGNEATVVDLSTQMLQASLAALRSAGSDCVHLAANAVALPFGGSCFDHVVFCDSVYNHIPGKKLRQRALLDASCLLRKGFLIVHAGWIGNSAPRGVAFEKLRVAKQWLCANFSAREPGDTRLRALTPSVKLDRRCFYHFFGSETEVRKELLGTGLYIRERIGGIWILQHPDSRDES